MKVFVTIYLFLIFLSFSCQKNNTNYDHGYWKISDAQHGITSTKRIDSSGFFILEGFESENKESNRLRLWFNAEPKVSGKYKMIDYTNTFIPGIKEVGITSFITPDSYYIATGINSMLIWPWPLADSADVIVENGKINVLIPKMLMRGEHNSGGVDSVLFNGIIKE